MAGRQSVKGVQSQQECSRQLAGGKVSWSCCCNSGAEGSWFTEAVHRVLVSNLPHRRAPSMASRVNSCKGHRDCTLPSENFQNRYKKKVAWLSPPVLDILACLMTHLQTGVRGETHTRKHHPWVETTHSRLSNSTWELINRVAKRKKEKTKLKSS